MSQLDSLELFRIATHLGASDLHLSVGIPPALRINGRLSTLQLSPLRSIDTEGFLRNILTDQQWGVFTAKGELDFSYPLPGVGRFRVNAYRQQGACAVAVRVLPELIPSFEELGLSDVIKNLVRRLKGLVLVTGPTGCGKSTTLAAMIDQINQERSCLVITLEAPIEYLHYHCKSIINQREIPTDTPSFAQGLRAALRQDPDVIMLGELRDLETTATCLTAAETGHLVLSSLHSVNAIQTVDRIIDIFPPYHQQQVRIQLAATLQGVIAQQLIPRADGKGMVLALEVMVVTPAIRNLIREGKTYQLSSAIQIGAKYGMQTLENSLKGLYEKGLITRDELGAYCSDTDQLQHITLQAVPAAAHGFNSNHTS